MVYIKSQLQSSPETLLAQGVAEQWEKEKQQATGLEE